VLDQAATAAALRQLRVLQQQRRCVRRWAAGARPVGAHCAPAAPRRCLCILCGLPVADAFATPCCASRQLHPECYGRFILSQGFLCPACPATGEFAPNPRREAREPGACCALL
jgi:hypothetical protein